MKVPAYLPKQYVLDSRGNAVRNPALEALERTLRAGAAHSGVSHQRDISRPARAGKSRQSEGAQADDRARPTRRRFGT